MCVVVRSQLERLQSRLATTETENATMKEQLGNLIGSVESLTNERDQLAEDKGKVTTELQKKLEVNYMECQ